MRDWLRMVAGAAIAAAVVAAGLLSTACGGGQQGTADPGGLAVEGKEGAVLSLTSTAFAAGGHIPARYTCEGADVSPPLAWTELPAGTASLALLVDDPDAPGGTFTHWLAWDFDPTTGSIGEGFAAPVEGKNGFGRHGYGGPCPPRGHGPHRYVFRLFALDTTLDLDPGADAGSFQEALAGHVLGTGDLIGTYERG